jgi:transposase
MGTPNSELTLLWTTTTDISVSLGYPFYIRLTGGIEDDHIVDLESGAVVAVTLRAANVEDTTTNLVATAIVAAEQVNDLPPTGAAPLVLAKIVGNERYPSNQTLIDLDAVAVRPYIAKADRGRRCWTTAPVYGTRHRVRGSRGNRLTQRRGEGVDRSLSHFYDTDRFRHLHPSAHQNILKRFIVHASAFNISLLTRQEIGRGTPWALHGRRNDLLAV